MVNYTKCLPFGTHSIELALLCNIPSYVPFQLEEYYHDANSTLPANDTLVWGMALKYNHKLCKLDGSVYA